MATDDDPKLRLKVLCSTCRSQLITTMTKLHDHAHYNIEVLIEPCETCVLTNEPPSVIVKPIELILNDSERCEISVDYVR